MSAGPHTGSAWRPRAWRETALDAAWRQLLSLHGVYMYAASVFRESVFFKVKCWTGTKNGNIHFLSHPYLSAYWHIFHVEVIVHPDRNSHVIGHAGIMHRFLCLSPFPFYALYSLPAVLSVFWPHFWIPIAVQSSSTSEVVQRDPTAIEIRFICVFTLFQPSGQKKKKKNTSANFSKSARTCERQFRTSDRVADVGHHSCS